MSARTRRAGRAEHLVLSALLAGLAVVLVHQDWLARWNHLTYDAHLALWDRPAPEDVVIVAIDEASLAALGRWPWPRSVHAELVRSLTAAGARTIALDIIFAEPDRLDADNDRLLAEALAESARVVLPVFVEQPHLGGQLVERLPLPPIADAAAGIGHVHAELDQDGIARGVYLREGLGRPHWPALGLAMLQVADPGGWQRLPGLRAPEDLEEAPQAWNRDHLVLIPFAGPPGRFARVSYHRALAGENPEWFRDRHVLVGVTATGLGDRLPTPVSGHTQPMPGVELNANLLASLRDGTTITPLGRGWQMLGAALLVLVPMLAYPRLRPRASLLVAGGAILGALALSAGLARLGHLWLPPAPAVLVIALSYPLWSWRRLEFTMRYLDRELAALAEEQAELPVTGMPRFEPAMRFLGELLPVRGWRLTDAEGRPCASAGEPPRGDVARVGAGSWMQRDGELWATLFDRGEEWRVGVRWGGDEAPSPAQRRLMTEVVHHFKRREEFRPAGTTELLEARAGQVQAATARLRELRQVVDDSLDQMGDGVLVVSSLGQVLVANRQAAHYLSGDAQAALVGRSLLELVDAVEPESPGWREALRAVVLEQRAVQLNARHRTGRDLLVQLAPLAGAEGRLGGLIFNLSDISALKESERRRAEILGFLSHDLRSPLVSVLALLELAEAEERSAPVQALHQRIATYASKTLELADQFLHLARAEGDAELHFHELDFAAVAHNAHEQVWAQAEQRGIRLAKHVTEAPCWVRGDAGLLERAVVNLLTNAVRYSPAGTEVGLDLVVDDGHARLSVRDQGPGIDPDELPHLFDRFRRARSAAGERKGAGLGLAFVKACMDRHGGHAEVASELGRGSCFCLVVPLYQAHG